jgi:hypothetical protein
MFGNNVLIPSFIVVVDNIQKDLYIFTNLFSYVGTQ